MTRGVFYKSDQSLFGSEKEKANQALFLWRLHGFMQLKNRPVFPFLAPLFLTNPLTDWAWENYISLQPLIKGRVKFLVKDYPP